MEAVRRFACLLIVAGCVLGAGCDTLPLLSHHHQKEQLSVAMTPVEGVYAKPTDPILGFYALTVGDLLEIKFPYRADLSETVSVRDDGMISLPLIDPVMAAGRTPYELQQELIVAYSKLEYDEASEGKTEKEYRIQPSDVLEVRFDNQPQFNDSVAVRPDGKISLGLVKTVVAEGKTPEELEKELTEKYARFIKTPDLVVIVRQFSGDKYFVDGKPVRPGLKNLEGLTVIVRSVAPRQVYIGGEVNTPGPIAYQYPMSAFQAILAAGGVPRTGQLSNVLVLRRLNQEEPVQFCINLKMDKMGKATNDIPLHPNDILYIQRTPIAKITNFLQQYFYDIFPMAKNSTFNGIYQFKFPEQAINFQPTSGQ